MKHNTLDNLFLFLKKPYNQVETEETSSLYKTKVLLRVFILIFLALLLYNLFLAIVIELSDFSGPTHFLEYSIKDNTGSTSKIALFLFVILTPILEEFIFRYPLSSLSCNKLSASFALFSSLKITNYFGSILWHPNNSIFAIASYYIYLICISFLLFYLFKVILFYTLKNDIIRKFWNRKFGLIFYTSAILFACAHNGALNLTKSAFYTYLLFLFPYFMMGISLGYIRIKLNLSYAIVLHYLLTIPAILHVILSS